MMHPAPVTIVAGGMLALIAGAVVAGDKDGASRLPPYPLGAVVLLADGGMVAGRLEAITPTTVVVTSPVLGRLDLPRASVDGYRASTALGPVPPRRPDPVMAEVAVLRLLNGDEAAAAALALVAGDVTIRMASPLPRDVTIPLAAVRAIDFAGSPGEARLPRRFVVLSDGSRFVQESLPQRCDPAAVVATLSDGDGGRLLATLAPAAYEQADTAQAAWPLARGHTLTGDWPTARGVTAFTGLGIHAPASVRYRLGRPAHRFKTLVAIDDSAGVQGSVIARVRAIDDAGRAREVHASPILRGGDEPHAIDVDLDGAMGIELVVDPADGSTALDRTIWLDPRVEFVSAAE
jgi:hypothetical protein